MLPLTLLLVGCGNLDSPIKDIINKPTLNDWLCFIAGTFLISVVIIVWLSIRVKPLNYLRVVEMLPSIISTLGVIGTFWGITQGLLNFNEKDLTNSIPLLLGGLKTAFFTSLAGMICSLILSSLISHLLDKKEAGVSDSAEAAGMVVQAVQALQAASDRQAQTQTIFYNTMQQVVKNIEAHIGTLNATVEDYKQVVISYAVETEHIRELLVDVAQTGRISLEKTEEQTNRLGHLLDHAEALVSGQEEITHHVAQFGEKLHGEVLEIEDKMGETNQLLTNKFEEFSELLKKSNTEALVEVMRKVTEEFQNQMNALINKLIQENFDQLNKSVERLNTWQQENKAMIQSLTSQYKQMAENFEDTSTSLDKVKEDTQLLVGEGGKLRQIVDALSQVIVEDEKFIRISTDLQKTADLTKTNYEQFDAATRSLNEWVKKQRNFVDGVTVLIQKLDELNNIRNYGEQFWQETRKQMNEGVGIIRGGTEALNQQVAGLNQQFYARLSTTLAQLDNCIQALINNQ